MKRNIFKIIGLLIIIMLVCARSTIDFGLIECNADEMTDDSAISEPKYAGEYDISYILSHYSYFVEENLIGSSSAHTVGGVVVGGILKLDNSLGMVKTADSYANTIETLSDYPLESWNSGEASSNVKFYYTTSMLPESMSWLLDRMQQTSSSYLDAKEAFSSIINESVTMTSNGKGRDSRAYNIQNGILSIDFSVSRYVTVAFSDFSSADSIELKNVSGKDFLNNDYIISVTGEGDINLDMADVTVDGVPLNSCYFMSLVNGTDSSYKGGQFYSGGLNLVWNFPYAASVTANSLSGHLVAPNGDVNILSGNHEGQVIAKNVYTTSEAHFYPCNVELGNDYETEPSTEEPSNEESSTEESDTEESDTEESGTEEPVTEESSTEEPVTEESSTEESSAKEASIEEPRTEVNTTEMTEVSVIDGKTPRTSDQAIPVVVAVIMAISGCLSIVGIVLKRKIKR